MLYVGAGYAGDWPDNTPQNITLQPNTAMRYRVPAPKGITA